jgi:hypothetical protein
LEGGRFEKFSKRYFTNFSSKTGGREKRKNKVK